MLYGGVREIPRSYMEVFGKYGNVIRMYFINTEVLYGDAREIWKCYTEIFGKYEGVKRRFREIRRSSAGVLCSPHKRTHLLIQDRILTGLYLSRATQHP